MRHFHHISQDIAANAFEDLKGDSGVHLVEIACSPESRLSAQIQREAGREDAAVRCSFWNGCDLGTGEGVKLIMSIIQEKRPKHVHISPECGPYSPMQNLNQKTAAQKQELEQKRRAALKQYVGASCVFQFCIQMGIHVTWEWAEKCQAWRLPMIQRLIEKYSLFVATTHGCQVNLRNGNGNLMKKGWKLMTTHKRVADMMHMPCQCQKGFRHATCEGNDTRKTAYYTMEYVKRFVEAIRYEMSRQQWMEELNGESRLPKHFGNGQACVCADLQHHETKLTCGSCSLETTVDLTGRTDTEDAVGRVFAGEAENANSPEKKRIQRQLYLLHAATGHSSTRNMIDALQKRGVSPQVMEEARRFKCQVCEEKQKLQPRQVASLEPLPPKWATACADGGNWTHPETQQTIGFAVIIDEGTRFRTARILSRGKKQTMNAAQFLAYFQEGWVQYFGQPQVLRLDPAGAFRSNEVETYCDKHSIYLDFVPAEAHWKFGICEQAVQGLKEVMNKLVSEQPTISAEEALSTAVQVFNHREMVRGYSPVQHAMGIAPDATGRFVHSLEGRAHDLVVGNPTGEFEDTIEKMKVAEQAHSEWNARERIKRALNSRSRETRDFRPGDLVYYWRKQLPKSMGTTKMGGYLGPARVLVTETKRETDGQLRKGSAVWVIRGRRLLKCAPEQLRHATQREELLEHLSKDEEQQAPWTLPRMVQQLGGQEYEDISHETPEDKPSVVEEMELEPRNTPEVPPQVRHRWKRPVDSANPEQQLRSRPPPAARHHMDEDLRAEAWWSQVEFQEPEQEAQEKWESSDMAIEVAIDMPSTNRGWKDMTRDMFGYFVGAMKRRAAEVSEKRLDEESREKFREAKAVEVKNFIAAKAFEIVPPEMRPPKEKAIGMRWILSWKTKEDGTQKAKARAILLGYQDPGYEHRATTTPVMTRQSRQFLLQIAAIRKWRTQKGDVSGAFLQGREYPGELFCIPCKEICEAMGVDEGTITKVKRGCYGLVDAPLEWYRSISQFLEQLGLQKTWSDPCLWVWKPQGQLRGIISCHVDDFLFTGPRNDVEWEGILKAIQQEYAWGEWQEKKFVQCGVQIEEMPDNSYKLSQPQYMEKVKEIPVNASRRKERNAKTSEHEQTQLRGALGALSWHAQQVAPHISAEVGLLLSEVKVSTVETLLRTNKLIYAAKQRQDHCLLVHHFPEDTSMGFFMWADAAGQNRPDGSSTQGLFLGIGPLNLLGGSVEKITPIAWHSNKIDRVTRSPGAAEAIAVVNGEDMLYHARHQWGEIHLPEGTNVFNVDEAVNSVEGTLISDSRNVYDKLQTEELSTKGAERRTDLELMCVKHSQKVNHLNLRWVHSEAQMGNSLTKATGKEIEMFYQLGHRWRIVSDSQMRSARKRKQNGMDVLEEEHTMDIQHKCKEEN